jgi:hypothetical protein
MIYQIVDWLATYIECGVFLISVVRICSDFQMKRKHLIIFPLFILVNTILIALCNQIATFSFLTPIVSISLVLIESLLFSRKNVLLHISGSLIVMFVILAVGYIIMIAACLLRDGTFLDNFQFFMTPGPMRCVYLACDKFSDIALLLLLYKHLPLLSSMKRKWIGILACGSTFAYFVTQYLFGAILSEDILEMREASIVSFTILLLFFVIFSILLLTITSRDQERMQRLIWQQTNHLMEKNYQLLHKEQQKNAKHIHDFHHHLQAILGIAKNAGEQKSVEYVQSLLNVSYQDIRLCHSGNDIIDAIINSSAADASRSQIAFHYDIDLSSPLTQISPADICAVLGNQVENAFESCMKIADTSKRFVQVSIHQNRGFIVIRVTNSAHADPFTAGGELMTDKDTPELHGLGIKSIQDTVKKYNGYLSNYYQDHRFYSEALLCFSMH